MKALRSRRGGFTLVELLVVIAIITVLIAILLPVFNSARRKARETACMANLHHIAMAVRMYRMDMGAYPGPYDPATGEGGLNSLYPYYLDSRGALICPDDTIMTGEDYTDQTVLVERWHEWDDANQLRLHGRRVPYYDPDVDLMDTLLGAASSMYKDLDPDGLYWVRKWRGDDPNTAGEEREPAFFVEHYSSYNSLYNWIGYAYRDLPKGETESEREYRQRLDELYTFSLCDLEQELLLLGDNLAFWYMWHRWDPENRLGLWNSGDNLRLVENYLHYHLAQQAYWYNYPNEVALPRGQQFSRLADNLGRSLWDPADPAWDPYSLGQPSSVFPGLINRNAPDNTIITRCAWHRRGDTPHDIVLRLDGSCAPVPGLTYDWAAQPSQTH